MAEECMSNIKECVCKKKLDLGRKFALIYPSTCFLLQPRRSRPLHFLFLLFQTSCALRDPTAYDVMG